MVIWGPFRTRIASQGVGTIHRPASEDSALRAILDGIGANTGAEYFPALVRSLARVLDTPYALVTELADDRHGLQCLAGWLDGTATTELEVPLIGTPCGEVIQQGALHVDRDVQDRYPAATLLTEWGAESYCGVSLCDEAGESIGHIAVARPAPMPDPGTLRVLESLAVRTGAELRRSILDRRLRRSERLLRKLVQGTAAVTGDDFFRSLVSSLADAIGVRYAFVSRFAGDRSRVRTLAFWNGESFLDNVEYALSGTPCERVLQGEVGYYPENVVGRFPGDTDLDALGVESYLAIPLRDSAGDVVGHLAAMDVEPMPPTLEDDAVLQVFGARAAAEIERLRTVSELTENEERLRDLFEEAPIAYVHEGLDSRFLRVNRTAMRLLGIEPHEVESTYGSSLVPDTPEAQARVKAALEAVGRGADTSGVVLELQRKDDGRPLFIQWWSRPDPSGTFTRTMFIDITEKILLERERNQLAAQNDYLRDEIKAAHNFDEIVGEAGALQKVFDAVSRVAPTSSSVLVTGETGTGKELIARAIHSRGDRRDRVLVKVNCAAIPAGLIESEMFGHEKGAFTGALMRKIGRFELADGGTIFLDEVGEIPLDLQSKLLRVLQEGEFERLGSTTTNRVDVRIIAATNRDLEQAVRDGEFRADLFYRLNVFPIHVPALRERMTDIPLLAKYFISRYAAKLGKRVEAISDRALAQLQAHAWPGNVRELENVIERALILCDSTVLDLGDWLPNRAPVLESGTGTTLQEVECAHIRSVLEETGWRVSGVGGAADLLGLKPTTLEARMKKLGIIRPTA